MKSRKIIAGLVVIVSIIGLIPTGVSALPKTMETTFGMQEGESKVLEDGTEVTYISYRGQIYNIPHVYKYVTEGDTGNTLKYDLQAVKSDSDAREPISNYEDGAYLQVDNIQRDSSIDMGLYAGGVEGKMRMLYAKAPVTVSYNMTEGRNLSTVIYRVDNYQMENGVITSFRPSRDDKNLVSVKNGVGAYTNQLEEGMYYVVLSGIGDNGVGFWIYVSKDGSDLSTTNTVDNSVAYPQGLSVSLNGSQKYIPSYKIANENYVRLRDLAYTLKDTDKHFDVDYNNYNGYYIMRTMKALGMTPDYKVLGTELASLPITTQTTPTEVKQGVSCLGIFFPRAYTVGGETFLSLSDLTTKLGVSISNTSDGVSIVTQ